MVAAAGLFLLHIGAYFQADDAIMREIPGSHPYLTGLGILGGMYSFDNPLQGDVCHMHCMEPETLVLLMFYLGVYLSSHCIPWTANVVIAMQVHCLGRCCCLCYLCSTSYMPDCSATRQTLQTVLSALPEHMNHSCHLDNVVHICSYEPTANVAHNNNNSN